jgi:hypothetical protein
MATEALEQAWVIEFELIKLREDLAELRDQYRDLLAGAR